MAYTYPAFNSYLPMGSMQPQQPIMGQNFAPMPAQTPVQPAQNIQATQGSQGLSPASRIVASKEEAMGVPADFNGTLMVFPDITHNRVFVKRWNFQSGAADFIEFAPVVPVPASDGIDAGRYVETDVFRAEIDALRDEINTLKKPVGKGGKKNDPDE